MAEELFTEGLRKVIVSTLSNKLCQTFGRIKEKGKKNTVAKTLRIISPRPPTQKRNECKF